MAALSATTKAAPITLPDWPRAHGSPLFSGQLRSIPQDFEVAEHLGWEFSDDGEHDYLWIEKTGANTEWVARQLALYADVPAKDVGYAGLKDRHAVTRQWFSVPRWNTPIWESLDIPGARLIDCQRHRRKLRRGAHRGNNFRIVLRLTTRIDRDAVEYRLATVRDSGVPNYFGEQRFGHKVGNLQLANDWARGKRLPRYKRSLAISTVRSYVFNEVLAALVEAGTWNHLVAGDQAKLDGSESVFEVSEIDEDLRHRCDTMDVHPAGRLPGEGSNIDPELWQTALTKRRVEEGTRSLRLPIRDLRQEFNEDSLILSFTLDRGAFATAVIREVCDAVTAPGS